jgi:hypothetical protein
MFDGYTESELEEETFNWNTESEMKEEEGKNVVMSEYEYDRGIRMVEGNERILKINLSKIDVHTSLAIIIIHSLLE